MYLSLLTTNPSESSFLLLSGIDFPKCFRTPSLFLVPGSSASSPVSRWAPHVMLSCRFAPKSLQSCCVLMVFIFPSGCVSESVGGCPCVLTHLCPIMTSTIVVFDLFIASLLDVRNLSIWSRLSSSFVWFSFLELLDFTTVESSA